MLPSLLTHELAHAHQDDLRREAARPGPRPERAVTWWSQATASAHRQLLDLRSGWRVAPRQACPSC